MPKKQEYLKQICLDLYKQGNHNKPTDKELINSDSYSNIAKMYEKLGGKLDKVPLNIGKYDIDLENFIIEFDEENHFNRYRLETLSSPIYKDCKNFKVTDYQLYCKNFEDKCRTYGKFWHTEASDKQYGTSSPNGVLQGTGSSRWKQRAFYDFVKDAYSMDKKIPIIRISIYDMYDAKTILDLIQLKQEEKLRQYIKSRADAAL